MAKLIDVDDLGEFEPIVSAQMRPVEAHRKQWQPLCHVLGRSFKRQRTGRTARPAASGECVTH